MLSADLCRTCSSCGDMMRPQPESISQSVDFPRTDSATVSTRRAAFEDVSILSSEFLPLSSDLSPSVMIEVFPALVLCGTVELLDLVLLFL